MWAMRTKNKQGRFLCHIGYPSSTSSCEMCRFFADMINPVQSVDESKLSPAGFQLRAYSTFHLAGVRFPTKRVSDTVVFAVVPTVGTASAAPFKSLESKRALKHILCADPTSITTNKMFVGRRVTPILDNFDSIRHWIQFCQREHAESCTRFDTIHLNGFRVIDCFTRAIIVAPTGCSYVSLSYVWGKGGVAQCLGPGDQLPEDCPVVVEDAIHVVQQLGFRYLWVDRYCINQSDPAEKHTQIANMDSIYSNAEVTIVAAAGSNSSFGLPGVRSTPRERQPYVTTGNFTLVSALNNPCQEINKSHWATRGWTYQEGLLSRRGSIFTEQQVYFQCLGMHCFESVSMPLNGLHTNQRPGEDLHAYRLYPSTSIAKDFTHYINRINEYNQRSLSYESDTLNAIAGVLKVFERSPPYVRHHWGLPIFPADNRRELTASQSFALSLAWNFAGPRDLIKLSIPNLSSTVEKPWAVHHWYRTVAIDIAAETTTRKFVKWKAEPRSLPDLSHCSRFIVITGWMCTHTIFKIGKSYFIDDEINQWVVVSTSFEREIPDSGTKIDMVLLGYLDAYIGGPYMIPTFLVVQKTRGYYTRLGRVSVTEWVHFEENLRQRTASFRYAYGQAGFVSRLSQNTFRLG